MGYDVHVTRTRMWVQSKAIPIPKEEWESVVSDDSFIHFLSGETSSKAEFSYCNKGATAVWNENENQMVYLNYFQGRIFVKNPDNATIKKLKEIAQKLNAYVIGDDGEEY